MVRGRRGDTVPWAIVYLLIAIVVAFAVIRVAVDLPNITSDALPDPDSFERRYAEHPWLAYAHISGRVWSTCCWRRCNCGAASASATWPVTARSAGSR